MLPIPTLVNASVSCPATKFVVIETLPLSKVALSGSVTVIAGAMAVATAFSL